MGWNSWNSFATTITEAQAIKTATIMAEKLLPSGYDVFTVDIQWYEPGATSYTYATKSTPAMDGFGRLLPAPNRFPSSAGGKGFRPLADRVHALGLQFGIHLMRGIPRLAVEQNLPVFGTKYRAREIADTASICAWNPDMYGVDMRKPGAQAYYDSVFALYASWGVDLVKMDDMSRPYDAHAPEIEAAHAAIVATKRSIILSLSPGETPLSRADHVRRFAQMWRISDDFWDEWPLLEAQFTRLENWNAHRVPGGWPDADMLPLGRLALGARDTKFTPDEQRTLMTLWSIARSPLIMGNQASYDNQPHFVADGIRVWSARVPGSQDRYLALFNTDKSQRSVRFCLDIIGLNGPVGVRDLWTRRDLERASGTLVRSLPSHGAALYRISRR
jgi:alpha-galactosidase